MPEYRPPQTRSASRKKAELSSAVGTGVTPSRKKLNTAGTPKIRTPAGKAKGKKGYQVEEEEDEDDMDLPLDVSESDDIHSAEDLDKDSDDAESDEEIESEDEIGKITYQTISSFNFLKLFFFEFHWLLKKRSGLLSFLMTTSIKIQTTMNQTKK